jgi:hypothetical protein
MSDEQEATLIISKPIHLYGLLIVEVVWQLIFVLVDNSLYKNKKNMQIFYVTIII